MTPFFLNGQVTKTACNNLFELIQSLGLENKRFAVEVNQTIIPKSQLKQTVISAQDCIEIIHAVGGG